MKALSGAALADISANSAALSRPVRGLRPAGRFYSDAMLSIVLFAPLARVAPRRAAPGRCVLGLRACSRSASPANADDASPALAAALVDQVRALALGKAAATPSAAARRGRRRPARPAPAPGALRAHRALSAAERPPLGQEPHRPALQGGPTRLERLSADHVKVWGRALVVPAGADRRQRPRRQRRSRRSRGRPRRGIDAGLRRPRSWSSAARWRSRFGPARRCARAISSSRQWFAAGETVKVVAAGDGFALEGAGQAITNGIEGQPARGAHRERPRRHRPADGRAPDRADRCERPAPAGPGAKKL